MNMKKYYMIAAVALCMASCTDNKENIPAAVKSGDEVAFSVSMPVKTKTAYGELANGSASRPVYWKDGDVIEVASPQCMEGRNVAQYKVNTDGTENLNYAKSLDKTGAYGVQWGETAATDCKFYAVYPSSEMTVNGSSVVANLSIASTQTVTLKKNADESAYEPASEDMVNNIMYAQPLAGQTQVVVDEATGNTTANLQFQPYSTVLHFNMAGWKLTSTVNQRNMVIYSVTVTANNAIAGDFDLTLKDDASEPTVGTATNTSNTITVEFKSGELRGVDIDPEKPFSFDMFLLPNEGLSIDENWTITVNTSAGKWTKNLKVNNTTANTTLTPGSIHVLPELPAFSVNNSWNYNPSAWIKDLDDTIYFTEVSLPGSWYSYSNTTDNSTATDIYQNNSISEQFDAGVRAFYIETKVGRTYRDLIKPTVKTSTVVVSGTGVAFGNGDALTSSAVNKNKAQSINSAIITIANKVKATKEFAVLTLAFADGGTFGVNATWRGAWISKIKDVLDETEVANALNGVLYTDEITPETTVKQLRGRLILKINIDDMYNSAEIANVDESNFTAIPALFSYTTYDWSNDSYLSTLKWKGKPKMENTVISSSSYNFYWNYTVANRTSSNTSEHPVLDDRKTAISQIILNSYNAHKKGKNNLWGMVGAGGSLFSTLSSDKGDPSTVSDTLNVHLAKVINEKVDAGEASPMGMVFVNFVTDTKGKELIESIIRMNSRFELGRKTSTDDTQTPVQSAKVGYSSGFNVDTENWNAF